jgi:hypothetical protein
VHINPIFLLVSVALLLPPIPFSAGFGKSLLSLRRNSLANAVAALKVWQNWIDFARAAIGVYLLTQVALTADPKQPDSEFKVLALQAAILGAVLLAQTVRWIRKVQLLAPVFYLCGLTLILGGWPPLQGAFAVAVGWLFAIGGKNLTYQLPAMAVALAAAGYVLGRDLLLMLNCALILFPPILGLLFRRKLIFAASVSTPHS